VLGYIASFPIPEVISGINATMLGAHSSPHIKSNHRVQQPVRIPKGAGAARRGSTRRRRDSCSHHRLAPAAMQIACRARKLAFGRILNDQVGPSRTHPLDHGQLGPVL